MSSLSVTWRLEALGNDSTQLDSLLVKNLSNTAVESNPGYKPEIVKKYSRK